MFGNNSPSLSDIAAVTGNNEFGGNNGWWILIILFAIFGGWGNGYGGAAAAAQGGWATQADVQRAVDQQTLLGKIDGQTYGIADLGYALSNQFGQAELSRANQQAALMSEFAQTRYNMATDTAAITNAINQAAQNIMQNDNANYRQLHDENIAIQMAALKDQLAQRDAQINQLQLAASQCAQNNYIISELRPAPHPAYVVANPYAGSYGCCSTSGCCGNV